MAWRRSYDTPPPPIETGSEYSQDADPRYADIGGGPLTECLADVVARFLPYFTDDRARPAGRQDGADRRARKLAARAGQVPRRDVRRGHRRPEHPDRYPAALRAGRRPQPLVAGGSYLDPEARPPARPRWPARAPNKWLTQQLGKRRVNGRRTPVSWRVTCPILACAAGMAFTECVRFRVSVFSALPGRGVAYGPGRRTRRRCPLAPRAVERRQRVAVEAAGITVAQMLAHIVSLLPLGTAVVDRTATWSTSTTGPPSWAWCATGCSTTRRGKRPRRTLAAGEDVEFDLAPGKRQAPGRVGPVGARSGAAAERGRSAVRRGLRLRPVRTGPDGSHPTRLRGQRQPRAQDAGRGDGGARRGAAGVGRRPRDGAPVRREGARRSQPAGQHGRRADRAVPAAGRRALAGPGARSTWIPLSPRRFRGTRWRPTTPTSRCPPTTPSGSAVWASRRCWSPRWPTWCPTRSRTRRAARWCRSAGAARRQHRDRRHRPRHRDRPQRPGAGLRTVLPRRQGALAGHRRHRLGLAIVKHVAANHNGSIRLWSQPGTGSTFTLSIPAYAGELEPTTGPSANCAP